MNKGYGLWREFAAEISKWIRTLTNGGYTVVFLGHEGTREFLDEKGAKYDKVYPKGEKRVVDVAADLSDIIGYAQPQPVNEKGETVNSTLYLVGTRSFHAGSRFTHIVPFIKEWTMEKLEAAIRDAIAGEEKTSSVKAVSDEKAKKKIEETTVSKWADKTFVELRDLCVAKGKDTINKTGSPDFYQSILKQEFGTINFKATQATEEQRPQIEQLLDALIAQGY